ncbi:XdhC family protein [Dyella sedimenti]|uniref:XdhC family protein n=1 Tax=Dyella sedimenti TaxID=2919947 RepID=UPI001FA9444C|nr:XdhC/CoxI family protein [Dyella sedimenti]
MNSAQEWRSLVGALRSLHQEASREAALATIVRTHGSTFRRPGTHMLVFDDGEVVCELSGGCPQRDILLRCLEAIDTGQAQVVSYNAESGMDVLMEMGCGGELDVLVEPLATPGSAAFADALARGLEQRRSLWLATLFAVDGATLTPRHLVSHGQHVLYDGLGDPAWTAAIADAIGTVDVMPAATRRLSAHGQVADVLIEPVEPAHALVVIGSNAAARALLPVADLLGWQLTLVDQDPQRLRAGSLPSGLATVCASPGRIREALALDTHSSVLVMTHNVEQDIAYLAALRDSPVAYIGALASRERAFRMQSEAGFADLRLHAPAGLDIGSETPTEIALAVVAEILAVLHRRSGAPLHRMQGSIHG